MAVAVQATRTSRAVPMDSYKSSQPATDPEDSFHRIILEKIEEGKRCHDPEKCQQILSDLMTMLKHLTADVNNYNLAFRETRPPFYMQEFQRLTDRIEMLTKARDTLTEYLRELEGENSTTIIPSSSALSFNEISSSSQPTHFQHQLQYSPTHSHSSRSSPPEKPHYQHMSSVSSVYSNTPDHSESRRPRSPTLTPSNFIRVHFPNKHTTALAPLSDETLENALESRASRHSVTNLRAYTPVYKISRQPCSWDITLDRLCEPEIVLEEKPKLDHSFKNMSTPRLLALISTRCAVCHHRIREAYKRCESCENNYHNHCYMRAPVCSHPIIEHIKNFGPDRFNNGPAHVPARSKEQSRSLPRIPLPRPSINTNQGIAVHGSAIASPEIFRPSMIKPSIDGHMDSTKTTPKYVSDWEIRSDDLLNHGRMVGRGTYGTVYKAEVRLHGYVALKELNFVSPTTTELQAFRNEVIALKKITHQNTLNFYGYILSPRFAIVTQWCEGSTLYKHIHILDRHWKISQLIDIARQICQGMSYLHDRGIIHRDLKSSNVFLDMPAELDEVGVCYRVKIGDFGLAAVKTIVIDGNNKEQPTGSILWMAPEVIRQKDPNCYSTSSDVYAYGCVLFEMFSERLPHAPIADKQQIMWQVGMGKLKIKIEQCRNDTPESVIELIRQCTEFKRDLRPNFAPEIEDTLSKFEFIFPRLQRSQSEPCLIRNSQDELLGLTINFGLPKTPISFHRRFNAEVS